MKTPILLVDGNQNRLAVLRRLLRTQEFEVFTALNGGDATNYLSMRAGIEVMITDFKIPGTDGLRLAESAKKLRPALRVILITDQLTTNEQRAVHTSDLFEHVLIRPLNGADLLQVIAHPQVTEEADN